MSMSGKYFIASFYQFKEIPEGDLETSRAALEQLGASLGIRGLVLLAREGVNATVSGDEAAVRSFVGAIAERLGHTTYQLKESSSQSQPFRRLGVQVRSELVTAKGHTYSPQPADQATHLSPQEWNQMLRSGQDFTLLDVRNLYESRIGTFRGAIAPGLKNFQELPAFLETSNIPKSKPLLMFCTGGIRCEKALPELQEMGFANVFQLDGGILNYFEACGPAESEFEGECFVFDHRVAVDQNLQPSAIYRLCPHCGDPADQLIDCGKCGKQERICERCVKIDSKRACSKNCSYHLGVELARRGEVRAERSESAK